MEQFVSNISLAKLETQVLPRLQGLERADALVNLAWHLRQRDSLRAIELANEAQSLLTGVFPPLTQSTPDRVRHFELLNARLSLVRGEVAWLLGELDAADDFANAATLVYARLSDRVGQGDTDWLLACLWHERGNEPRRDLALRHALGHFEASHDLSRVAATRASLVEYAAHSGSPKARTLLNNWFDAQAPMPQCVATSVYSARAFLAKQGGDVSAAATHFLQAREAAEECGRVHHIISAGCKAAGAFAQLGMLTQALHWSEQALKLARKTQWPALMGYALQHNGRVLQKMGDLAQAHAIMSEAHKVMRKFGGSLVYAQILLHLGELSLDLGDAQTGLAHVQQAERRAVARMASPFSVRCVLVEARALEMMGHWSKALSKTQTTLKDAQALGLRDEVSKASALLLKLQLQMSQATTVSPSLS